MRKSRTRTGIRPLRAGVAVAATAAAVVAGTANPAFAALFTVNTTQVAVGGGTVVYFQGTGTALNNKGVRFITPNTATCPAAYNTAAAVDTTVVNAGLTSGTTTRAWLTSPALPAAVYKPCLYADASTGNNTGVDTTAGTVTSVHMGPLSATTGALSSRVTLTVPTANLLSTATFTTQFVAGEAACPTTFTTPDATHINAATTRPTATSLSITVPTLVTGTPYYVCTYSGTTNATSPLAARGTQTFANYSATLPTVTLGPTSGSSGTATNVLINVPTTSAVFTGTPDVLFSRASCPAARPANASLGGTTGLEPWAVVPTKITNSKLAVVVPVQVIVGGADVTTPWNVCVYASTATDAVLLAMPATYSVAAVLSVASTQFQVGDQISPTNTASGPSQGGSKITITGLTGIPTQTQLDGGATLSAALGGSPITITSATTTSISGTTTNHAPGAVDLSVTTAAGTQSTSNQPYTYKNGISVVPNTAAEGTTPVLDITGAGFLSIPTAKWGAAIAASGETANATLDKARVLLTDNAWTNRANFTNGTGITPFLDANSPTAQCTGVLVISDVELICTMDLTKTLVTSGPNTDVNASGGAVAAGVYNVTIINTGTALGLEEDLNNYSVVSSGSTFTVSPF